MKIVATALMLGTLQVLSVRAVAQPEQPAFSINIQGPQTAAKLDNPVKIDITLTNLARNAIGMHFERSGRSELTYEVYMEDPNGTEAPTTAYLRAVRGQHLPGDPDVAIGFSTMVWVVQPGKSLTTHVDLAQLYQIKGPGTYKVWVARRDELSKTKIKSNRVIIKVSP